jgi:hypothetical protein
MPCHAMHPIQDLFLKGFSYVLQIGMHFICTPMWTKFYSCKKWVLHKHAYDCDKESCEMADRLTVSAELQELKKALAESPWTQSCLRPRPPRCSSNWRTHLAKWSHYPWRSLLRLLTWEITWTPNRNSCSSNPSRKIGTSSHGSLLTCREFLGS